MSTKLIIEIEIPSKIKVPVKLIKSTLKKAINLYFSCLFMKINKSTEEMARFKLLENLDESKITSVHYVKQEKPAVELVDEFLAERKLEQYNKYSHSLVKFYAFQLLHGGPSDETLDAFVENKKVYIDNLLLQLLYRFKTYLNNSSK